MMNLQRLPKNIYITKLVDALRNNAFSVAIANFQQLEALFPFGQYAAQASN